MKLRDLCDTLSTDTKLACIHAARGPVDLYFGDVRYHRRKEYLLDTFEVVRLEQMDNVRIVGKYTSSNRMHIDDLGSRLVAFCECGQEINPERTLKMETIDIDAYVKEYNDTLDSKLTDQTIDILKQGIDELKNGCIIQV